MPTLATTSGSGCTHRQRHRAIVVKLHEVTMKVVRIAAGQEKLSELGVDRMDITPDDLDAYVRREIASPDRSPQSPALRQNRLTDAIAYEFAHVSCRSRRREPISARARSGVSSDVPQDRSGISICRRAIAYASHARASRHCDWLRRNF